MKIKFLLLLCLCVFIMISIIKNILITNITDESNISTCSSLPKKNVTELFSSNNLSLSVNNKKNFVNSVDNSGTVIITIPEFINDMQCSEYILKNGDTLTSIAKKYISTCTLNSALKLIKEANKISNPNQLTAGTKIRIPEAILNNGYIHTVTYGDTWSKICRDYYPIYNSEYLSKVLIFINDLPDNTLPLQSQIYLPNINI